MKVHNVFDVIGAVVFIGLVTAIGLHPQIGNVVKDTGSAFSNVLGTAIKG